MTINIHEIGTIQLPKNVIISDPCYKADNGSNESIYDMNQGTYHVILRKSDEGEWGNRISRLMVVHEDYLDRIDWKDESPYSVYGVYPLDTKHRIVGVDSGCMGIYDRDYFVKNMNDTDWYYRTCGLTDIDKGRGGIQDNCCAVSEAGYGDGGYDACIVYDKNKSVAIIVDFSVEEWG